jgi:hypothetical protein
MCAGFGVCGIVCFLIPILDFFRYPKAHEYQRVVLQLVGQYPSLKDSDENVCQGLENVCPWVCVNVCELARNTLSSLFSFLVFSHSSHGNGTWSQLLPCTDGSTGKSIKRFW